jgi:predicted dithiol-disulfide oxidoreductase (DUF899 family)
MWRHHIDHPVRVPADPLGADARGLDMLVGAYNYLDLVPKGRDKAALPWTMAWVRHHDRYGPAPMEA